MEKIIAPYVEKKKRFFKYWNIFLVAFKDTAY